MSIKPDETDGALWEALGQSRPWIVQSIRPNGEAVRVEAALGWTLEAALRKAHIISPDGSGSLAIIAVTTGNETMQINGRQIWRLWQRLGLKAKRDPSEEWADLVEDWRSKHDAVLSFPLYDCGWMKTDLLPEYEDLAAAEQSAKARMDAFIAAHP